jgi:glycerol-3-phosphate dehydrogenase
VEEEMARSVGDVLDRRTRASLRDARGAADAAPMVAALIGPVLGWDEHRMRQEAESYTERIRTDLAGAGLDPNTHPVTQAAAHRVGPGAEPA